MKYTKNAESLTSRYDAKSEISRVITQRVRRLEQPVRNPPPSAPLSPPRRGVSNYPAHTRPLFTGLRLS